MRHSPDPPGNGFEHLTTQLGADLNSDLETGFAARFIRRKAKQLVGKAKLSDSDRPDIEQELKIALLKRLRIFDPDILHWNAFVTMVVEQGVGSFLEVRKLQKCEHSHDIVSLSNCTKGEDDEMVEIWRTISPEHSAKISGQAVRSDEEQVTLQHDIQVVLESLPDDLRDLCVYLKTGTISDAARQLNLPRSTVVSRLERIREIFEDAGLEKF